MKWENPPPIRAYYTSQPEPKWIAECRKRPGEWALVIEGIHPTEANHWQFEITHQKKWFDGEKWEATKRTMVKGKANVWARFISNVDAGKAQSTRTNG